MFTISCQGSKCANYIGKRNNIQLIVRFSSSSKPPTEQNDERAPSPNGPSSKSGFDLEKIFSLNKAIVKVMRSNYDESVKAGNEFLQKKLAILSRKTDMNENVWYSEKVGFWMQRYENFVGLTEVKAAQQKVVEAERQFIAAQDVRRETQLSVNDVQKRIKEIHDELERTHRGEDRYLNLVTQEHQILKEDRILTDQLVQLERSERLRFSELSNAVRDSHEKERSQAEKTKYWSVIGSVVGTCIGILGTTINNRLRMNELRQIVRDASNGTVVADGTTANDVSFSALQKTIEMQEKKLYDLSQKLSVVLPQIVTVGNNVSTINSMLMEMKKDGDLKIMESNGSRHVFDLQRKTLEKLFDDMKSTLQMQNMQSTEALARATEALHSQTVARIADSVNKSNSASYKSFHTRACEIDEKVKDIRSLILSQGIPNSSRNTPKAAGLSQSSKIDPVIRPVEGFKNVDGNLYVGILLVVVIIYLVNKIS